MIDITPEISLIELATFIVALLISCYAVYHINDKARLKRRIRAAGLNGALMVAIDIRLGLHVFIFITMLVDMLFGVMAMSSAPVVRPVSVGFPTSTIIGGGFLVQQLSAVIFYVVDSRLWARLNKYEQERLASLRTERAYQAEQRKGK